MNTPSLSMRDLARRLLAANQTAADPHIHVAVAVSEKLRIVLTKFVGAAGYDRCGGGRWCWPAPRRLR